MIRNNNNRLVLEYIWIGGNGELHSKTKVLDINRRMYQSITDLPIWNYDGSSTDQADIDAGNTEVILKPCGIYKDPLRNDSIKNYDCYLILCETFHIDDSPLTTNSRNNALLLFNKLRSEEPWFGLEQEYFMYKNEPWGNREPKEIREQKEFYCGTSLGDIQRKIAEEHLAACLEAGLTISGINAEVAYDQWEFQVGPCGGIDAADQLYVARYLLERIAEKYNVRISYEPKRYPYLNGSGCHTNFSTLAMRSEGGIAEIYTCMEKMEKAHEEHIIVYGKDNDKRLTGKCETASIEKFSFGVGTRNTSVRIPNQTVKDGFGYFEDRRPAANMDPYLVTSRIFQTCCLGNM